MGYKEVLTVVSKFKKPNLPLMWNGLFTLLFKCFSERVTGSDCASKLFMTIMYGIYLGVNLDYGSMLWAQFVQNTLSNTRHDEISCARFWTLIVQRAIDRLNISVIKGSCVATIQIFHTTKIILDDTSIFTFICSVLETMLRNVPAASEVRQTYRSVPTSNLQPITDVVRKVLKDIDKPKKGWKKRTTKAGPSETTQIPKKKVKRATRKPRTPTPSDRNDSQSNTVSYIPVQDDVHHKLDVNAATSHPQVSQPIPMNHKIAFQMPTSVPITFVFFHGFTLPHSPITTTTLVSVNASNVGAGGSGFTFGHDSTNISPLCHDDPNTIFWGDDNF